MNLKNSIFRVFSANFLRMLSAVLISFLVPMILSVESYSYVKTYTFYLSYMAFFGLGFLDGMYLKYGGKEIDYIDKSCLKKEHNIFLFIQLIFSILIFIISVLKNDTILFLLSISIIPCNGIAFYTMIYQATGQFKQYTYNIYIHLTINLILNAILVLVLKNKNYIMYCLAPLVGYIVLFIYLERKFLHEFKYVIINKKYKVLNNIKVGFFILLGNLSLLMFYAIDRWFIKLFYTVNDFAYYSFAVSMLNVINLLINSISVTFYNYLAKGEDESKIKELNKYLIIIGAVASSGYFVFAMIINIILKKYIPSLSIIAISFAAYPYMIVINALYVNLYKARKNEKRYLKVVAHMLFIAIIYNVIAIILYKSIESIAIATTFSFITWYIYSKKDFKYLKGNLSEYLYLAVITISFLICSNFLPWLLGGCVYIAILIITTFIVYMKEIKEIKMIVIKS